MAACARGRGQDLVSGAPAKRVRVLVRCAAGSAGVVPARVRAVRTLTAGAEVGWFVSPGICGGCATAPTNTTSFFDGERLVAQLRDRRRCC